MKSKLGNRGFVASAVLYVMLGLFISLMIGVIAIYSNRKILMDKVKEEVITQLEEDNKVGHLVGTREEYFDAALAYINSGGTTSNCAKQANTVLVNVRKLISNNLLPSDIVSPITNRKEITQNNFVVAVKQGSNYSFSYVDNATASVICGG